MPLATSAVSAALGPGMTSTGEPRGDRGLHEDEPRIADERHARVAHQRDRLPGQHPVDEPRRGAALGVGVVAHALGGDAVAVEQDLARARVLARDRSASRSAASVRSVMSSRLPIGVGQTISRPAPAGLTA